MSKISRLLDHYARNKAKDAAIDLALSYLRVCHLANHVGCQIKVDQAIKVLEAINADEI